VGWQNPSGVKRDAQRSPSMPLPRSMAAAFVILALPLWMGCSARPQTAGTQPAMQARPRSTASLTVLSPAPGEAVSGSVLHVRLRLSGGEVVPQTSTNLTPDKGHVHLSVDGKVVSMLYGLDQDVPVTPGVHLLQAEFVATDHFPFNPRVLATITFTDQ